MADLRFDGRVAVVTGAGRGLGRAYAHLLAALGASVVVNDLGGSMSGRGADAGPASTVVDEITAAGGTGAADTNDISTAAGAQGLIDGAVERYGRLDVLVNNAGIMRWATMPDIDDDSWAQHLAVHLTGSFNTARAAWAPMVEQGYGRIVMTTSAAVFGLPNNTAYAAAKGGVIGLTRSLMAAGREHGIKVNLIAPAAWTRMAGAPTEGDSAAASPLAGPMAPELVAPMVAFLAHEDCPVSGQLYEAGAGRFSRIFLASTPGYVHPSSTPTVDDIAAHWAAINDETGYVVHPDLPAWSEAFMAHLRPGASEE